MINVVYWGGTMTRGTELLFNLAVLVGTFIGQFVVGILADRYGRKRMYGIELLVLMLATVLVSITSAGVLSGTHRLAWFVSWRFIMGIGIGGDYPLSAVVRIVPPSVSFETCFSAFSRPQRGIKACHQTTRTY